MAEPLDLDQLAAARAGDQQAFQKLTDPYRRELRVHCYRLLGSVDDAEDLVQETYLRAWRGLHTFVRPDYFRAWLYKIATNACLNALASRPQRLLPNVNYPPGDPAAPIAAPLMEPIWMQPLPDAWLTETLADPEAGYAVRESVSLAFAVALQLLPPRQRAVLILFDVLDWSANEAAELLEMTVPAVNSALHRARTTLAENRAARESEPAQPAPGREPDSDLLEQYVRAMQNADVTGLVALLKDAATFTMPPIPTWFKGSANIGAFLGQALFAGPAAGRWRLLPARANRQPAFGLYARDDASGVCYPYAIQVLTVDAEANRIAEIDNFAEASLFPRFNLPPQLNPEPPQSP